MNDDFEHYIEKVRRLNDEKFRADGRRRSAFVRTFGCQMNAHDSEKITGMLSEMGFLIAEDEKSADAVVLNTCCVRENAENKIFGNIGYLKKIKEKKKDFLIIVCGCMTQREPIIEKLRESYGFVDVIFGTHNLHMLPEYLFARYETGKRSADIWDGLRGSNDALPVRREKPFKASINIMYGCDNFCSYCIVPYVRGRETSRPPEDVIREAEALAADSVKEILLLGQNVNSYAAGFPDLLRKINEIGGIGRIRFMTSHPKDMSDDLIRAMRDSDKVCKHLHLPVQAGSDRILSLMNRKYTRGHYLSLLEKVRDEIPGITVTTDIIAGFPGETEDDFQDTLDLVKRARFAGAYTFRYSKRDGTRAALMDGQVPDETAKDRLARLMDAVNPIILEINKEHEGHVLTVLAESRADSGVVTGRTDGNAIVHFNGAEEMVGNFVDVNIIEAKTFYLKGETI